MLILMISLALCTHHMCHAVSDISCTQHDSQNSYISKNLLLHCRACLPAKVRTALSGSLYHFVYLGIREPLDLSQALSAPWQMLAYGQVPRSIASAGNWHHVLLATPFWSSSRSTRMCIHLLPWLS